MGQHGWQECPWADSISPLSVSLLSRFSTSMHSFCKQEMLRFTLTTQACTEQRSSPFKEKPEETVVFHLKMLGLIIAYLKQCPLQLPTP